MATLFSGAELLKKMSISPCEMVENWSSGSENTFKDYKILHMYIAQGQGQIAPKITQF